MGQDPPPDNPATPAVDYDALASSYDRRYALHGYPGIEKALRDFVAGPEARRVLEVGCGTGRWLELLAGAGCTVAGIEPAARMLAAARARVSGDLRQGVAEALPWPAASFDRVVYVNSFHHLVDPPSALREARRVLCPGGRLLSIGLDPHAGPGRWYVYEYFPGALAADRARFPSGARRLAWLREAGFADVEIRVAEVLRRSASYAEALRDGILERSFTSQLGVISAPQYESGLERIRECARQAADCALEIDVTLYSTAARRAD